MADFVFKFMIRANDLIRVTLSNHKRRHLVVVMDQAPCHTSKMVKKFIESKKRLHVFFLPPKSPEYNPDEQVSQPSKIP